jgi:hypothetical protein
VVALATNCLNASERLTGAALRLLLDDWMDSIPQAGTNG